MEAYIDFASLVGEVLVSISGCMRGSDEIVFTTASGRTFRMYHERDCCESVVVEDVIGDPKILLNLPITVARVDSNQDNPLDTSEYAEPHLWTFYNIGTARGTVTLRWYGTSNGYYSMSVSFEEFNDAKA